MAERPPRRVLLLGGGHAHAYVLRALAERPLPQARVTLLTPDPLHTYSGMLPGLIAGHYRTDEVQIDLAALARRAGVGLRLGRVTGVDADVRAVRLEDGAVLDYDLASLNLGSLPNTRAVPGAAEHALAAKPFERFLAGWQALLERPAQGTLRMAVVGAGAAGVEVAMAIAHRFDAEHREASVELYSDRAMFVPALARRVERALATQRVRLHRDTAVRRIDADGTVVSAAGRARYDLVVWTAGAAPLPWLRGTRLRTDDAGFVLVDATLRSVSHPSVFVSGDTATLESHAHPKSGVFAVRHGAVLAGNLRAALDGRALERYRPQQRALAILSCGSRHAIAAWDEWSIEGAWVWRWKDWLDRRWMGRFAA